ncbi:phosphomannomutase/phosphoglucomutase [Clostridium sp. MSJ-11]|uniref:Phosphomannomutase/phosphoglucomutase n=1 Tax=Clostridium mobile TaxID=2841512 RepID=A0ABS6EGM1_9CLOT|nr:phosphomannomutase/phosphoglucomutase [Clostridium mobile]MBU5483922.1 phosphomannomutase/phosphoglucomutase [Clostridium mobile]
MGIYKECDIRGVYIEEFDGKDAYHIGRAIGTLIHGKTVVVGGDVRVSTPILKELLIQGLINSGIRVMDIGRVTTPALYFAKDYLKTYGGVMVTASHNPAKYNGFKIILGNDPITPEEINSIKDIVDKKEYLNEEGKRSLINIDEEYKEYIKNLIGEKGNIKVVIDCGNGTTSKLAPEIFREMGYEVKELFCEFDGSFPNREPNPAAYSNLKKLQQTVLENKADLGVAFDGDGDRVVFVDDKGRIVQSEEAFVFLIHYYLQDYFQGNKINPCIVYDLKSSSIVKRKVESMGGIPIMEKSGHTFIKSRFIKERAILAGEISGHFFFHELGKDDGIYAAIKIASIISKEKVKISEFVDGIEKTTITPDIRIPWHKDKREKLLDKFRALKSIYNITELDGVKIEFEGGWLLIRKSVTEPCVTLRMEGISKEYVNYMKEEITRLIPELKGKFNVNI